MIDHSNQAVNIKAAISIVSPSILILSVLREAAGTQYPAASQKAVIVVLIRGDLDFSVPATTSITIRGIGGFSAVAQVHLLFFLYLKSQGREFAAFVGSVTERVLG